MMFKELDFKSVLITISHKMINMLRPEGRKDALEQERRVIRDCTDTVTCRDMMNGEQRMKSDVEIEIEIGGSV